MTSPAIEDAPLICPLCGSGTQAWVAEVAGRLLFDCAVCGLVHVPPSQRPSAQQERAEYELHQNNPHDAGYRRFLGRVAEPLLARLEVGSSGLDYGSGPGPTLSVMLEEAGHHVRLYDPYFAPDTSILARHYDFITCTETAEHFFEPGREFRRLLGLVRPGGTLAVMTEVLGPERALETWAYARDPTHVCFYRDETFEFLAGQAGAELERPHPNVAFFRV